MIIERHNFSRLPLRVTGNVQVAEVSGHVLWKLRDNGGSLSLTHIEAMVLKAEGGGEVHVIADAPLYHAVREELERVARSLSNRSRNEDAPIPMSDKPYDSKAPGDLDNAMTEGAQNQSPTT